MDVSVKTSVAFCSKCNGYRPVWQFRINHVYHLILTCLTGVWGLVWLVRGLYNRWGIGWRCAQCNHHVRRSSVPD